MILPTKAAAKPNNLLASKTKESPLVLRQTGEPYNLMTLF